MEVQIRYKCPECGGSGFITHPLWREYFKRIKTEKINIEEYWKEKGYDNPPPEEITCPKCNGTGWHYEWVDIKTFKIILSKY